MTAINPIRHHVVRAPDRAGPGPRVHGVATTIDPMRVLRRHMLGIVLSIIIGGLLGGAAFVGLLLFFPQFSSESLFELQPGVQDPTAVVVQDVNRDDLIERLARTQTVLLTSREVLAKAMEDPLVARTDWHKKFVGPDGVFDIQEAVDELEDDLRAPMVRGTNLFSLTWSARKPNDVPVVLNAITDAYVSRRQSLDTQVILENSRMISGRLEATEAALRDLSSNMEQFILERGLMNRDDPRYSPMAIDLNTVLLQINETELSLSLQRSTYEQARRKLEGVIEPSYEDQQFAEQDQRMVDLILKANEAESKLAEYKRIYGATHQEVLAQEKAVLSRQEQRDTVLASLIRQNLESRMRTADNNIKSLESSLDQLEEEAEEKSKRLKELTAYHSAYAAMETQREQLESERQRHIQMSNELQLMRLRYDASRVRVAQRALPPREPSFPRVQVMLPLGVLLSLGLTLAWIFFRELTDQRIKSASDLDVLPHATVLGSIPDLEDDPTRSRSAERVVREHPNSVLAESYRQACNVMCRSLERNGFQTLLMFSALPGAGNTTSVTNFAAVLAAMGKRVCVLDADFRRPRLAKAMGVDDNGPGLGELLGDAAVLDDVILDADGIDVIPAGTPGERIIERLGSTRLTSLLAELRARYDVVLIDSPPAVVAGDALAMAGRVDAAVLVVRANREQRGLVARLIAQFSETSCHFVGMLLNRPLSSAGGYFKKNYAAMAKYGMSKTG